MHYKYYLVTFCTLRVIQALSSYVASNIDFAPPKNMTVHKCYQILHAQQLRAQI